MFLLPANSFGFQWLEPSFEVLRPLKPAVLVLPARVSDCELLPGPIGILFLLRFCVVVGMPVPLNDFLLEICLTPLEFSYLVVTLNIFWPLPLPSGP